DFARRAAAVPYRQSSRRISRRLCQARNGTIRPVRRQARSLSAARRGSHGARTPRSPGSGVTEPSSTAPPVNRTWKYAQMADHPRTSSVTIATRPLVPVEECDFDSLEERFERSGIDLQIELEGTAGSDIHVVNPVVSNVDPFANINACSPDHI